MYRCLEMMSNEEWVIFWGRCPPRQCIATFYNQFDTFNNLVNVVRFQLARLMLWDITSEQTHPPLESATDFLFRNVGPH
jgi:hypothetical protein